MSVVEQGFIRIVKPRDAAVYDLGRKQWWTCPNCSRTIGEIIGPRLIIIIRGRQVTFPLVNGMTQTCPNCGQESQFHEG